MCALSTPAKPAASSFRRVHSPPATSAAERSPPKNSRMPGPIRPASIEYLTRKMPPSASATPPIQTVQRVPNFSSKLFAGASSAAGVAAGEAVQRRPERARARARSLPRCGRARRPAALMVSAGAAAGTGGGWQALVWPSGSAPPPVRSLRARGLRLQRLEAGLHARRRSLSIDRLDQRHDGDDRERQQQQSKCEEFHGAPPKRESMPAERLSKARQGATHRAARALVALSPIKVQGWKGLVGVSRALRQRRDCAPAARGLRFRAEC